MGIGGGGDSSDTDLEAVLEASVKAVHGISDVILGHFRRRLADAIPLQISFSL